MRATAGKFRLVGLGLIAVMLVAIYLAITAINGVPAFPYKTVNATFVTASNLVSHDDVRVDGARIGQITKTTFDPKTQITKVQMQLQGGHPVYADATAAVGDVSALGSEYVALQPGTQAAGSLPSGGIPLTRTTTPVEIDSLLNILGPKQADAAAAATQTLGQAFGGQGRNLNTILRTAPSLLPAVGTTTATLSDPVTALIPLIAQSNLLASRFQGRTQQLAQLLVNLNTTFAALDTQNGNALQSTINDAAPALPILNPALNALGAVAGQTATAMTDLRPGFAALGTGTPDLRVLLRESVSPLQKVPAVSRQAIPGVKGLSTTFSVLETSQPVAPFLAQLEKQADPFLSYMAPYTVDMTNLWSTLANGLGKGDHFGNWLPFTVTVDGRSTTGKADPSLLGRCAYPSPNTSKDIHGNQSTGVCK